MANTHRLPGRSTRATSRITRAESATNGTAPNAVNARSNVAVPEREMLRVGLYERYLDAGRCSARPSVAQHPGRKVDRRRLGALRG